MDWLTTFSVGLRINTIKDVHSLLKAFDSVSSAEGHKQWIM